MKSKICLTVYRGIQVILNRTTQNIDLNLAIGIGYSEGINDDSLRHISLQKCIYINWSTWDCSSSDSLYL